MKYVIIGNSTAAVAAAEAIRTADREGLMTIISDEPHHTYSRPLISYYLFGRTDENKMKYRGADFYEKNGIIPMLGNKVVGIDASAKLVILENGTHINYEKLLIATGSRPAIPPIKGLQRNNVFNFIKLDDARLIEKYAVKGSKAVVIGASFSGLKAVECLVERGVSVTTVDIADRLMPRLLDASSSLMVEKVLADRKVRVILQTSVVSIEGGKGPDSDAESVIIRSADGRQETLPCDFAVVATGVAPNIGFLANSGVKTNRGILVDDKMATNIKDIYAAGDVAEVFDHYSSKNAVIATIPSAFEQGEAAGLSMAGLDRKYRSSPVINSMPLFDITVMGAGITESLLGTETIIRQKTGNGVTKDSYMKFVLAENHLVGYLFVNEASRAGIYTDIIRNRIDIAPFRENLGSDEFGFLSMPSSVRQGMLYAGIET